MPNDLFETTFDGSTMDAGLKGMIDHLHKGVNELSHNKPSNFSEEEFKYYLQLFRDLLRYASASMEISSTPIGLLLVVTLLAIRDGKAMEAFDLLGTSMDYIKRQEVPRDETGIIH